MSSDSFLRMVHRQKSARHGVERPSTHLLSQAHQNHTTFGRTTNDKRTDSIRKDLPQLQTQRRNSVKWEEVADSWCSLVPYSGGGGGWGATHKLENNYIAQVLPKHYRRPWAPRWAPQHQKNKPPDHLALKASRTSFQESQKPMGNRDSTPKGDTHNLTLQDPGKE